VTPNLRDHPLSPIPGVLRWGVIWLAVALYSASWIVTANGGARGAERWDRALWLNLGSYAIWGLLAIPLVRLSRRWPRRRGWPGVAAKLLLAAGFAVAHAAVFVLVLSVRFPLRPVLDGYGVALSHTLRFNFHFDLLTGLLVLFADESLGWYRRYRLESVRTARLAGQVARLRLDAARLQLPPHFVFNALNSVAELLFIDAAEAERLVLRLASLMRTMLETAPDQLVRLREELDVVRRYLEIERVRLGERLTWVIEASPAAEEVQVPSMLFQPLVDRAIVHGILEIARPGEIRLTADLIADRLHLVLTADAPREQPVAEAPDREPLAATRRRLDFFFGGAAWLRSELTPSGDRSRVVLSLPLAAAEEPLVRQPMEAVPEVVWSRS